MQAVILAAGASRRLRPLTNTIPKCLLKIGSRSLLDMTIDNILANGIRDFVFVTGYLDPLIKDHVKKNYPGLAAVFLSNKDFENNNNSYSLWMTRDHVKGSMLLLDSDILFDAGIITALLNSGHENSLAVHFSDRLDEEQMKVIISSRYRVLHIGKHLPLDEAAGESIGIELFSPYLVKQLYAILTRKIVEENNVNEFYETAFQELIDEGNDIYAVDISESMVMEVDTPEDLTKAQELFRDNE